MEEKINDETEVSKRKSIHVEIEVKKEKEKEKECKCENCLGISTACIDLIKWFLGSVVLVFLGPCINNKIQETQTIINNNHDSIELRLKQMDIDSKLIESVSGKFDVGELDSSKSYQKEANYLNFIVTFISTDSLIKNINGRLSALKSYLEQKEKPTMDKSSKRAFKDSSNFNEKEKADLKRIDARAPGKFEPISVYIDSVDNHVKNGTASGTDSLIKKIQQTSSITTPVKDEENYYLTSQQTLWCKRNYYVIFNNTLRIGINELTTGDHQSIKMNLIDNESPTKHVINDDQPLSVGETFTLDYNKRRYKITLSYIGAAGKNPFTKAAYLSVATYSKQ